MLPSNWERSLLVRPTGLTPSELFWQLHRAPEQPDEKLSVEHGFRIATFARAVFVWAEIQLVRGNELPYELAIWSQLKRQSSEDSPLPYLEFDVDFLLTDGGVTVGRLNDFSQTFNLSDREFALCLLFDGTTIEREAELSVYGADGGGAVTSLIDRLEPLTFSTQKT